MWCCGDSEWLEENCNDHFHSKRCPLIHTTWVVRCFCLVLFMCFSPPPNDLCTGVQAKLNFQWFSCQSLHYVQQQDNTVCLQTVEFTLHLCFFYFLQLMNSMASYLNLQGVKYGRKHKFHHQWRSDQFDAEL